MTATQTATRTSSFTFTDIRDVVRQLTTDLKMIGSSSSAMSEQDAADYGHDIEALAANGYLSAVDVTLIDAYGAEVRAVRYDVDEDTGQSSRADPAA